MNRKLQKRPYAICIGAAAIVLSVAAGAQRRDDRQQDNRRAPTTEQRREAGQRESTSQQPQREVFHARREEVRTNRTGPPPRTYSAPPVREIFPRRDQTMPQRTEPTAPPTRTTPTQPWVRSSQERRSSQNESANQRYQTDQRVPPNQGYRTGTTGGYAHMRTIPNAGAARTFTQTPDGRRYDNGIQLRRGRAVDQDWQRRYFPRGRYHFPYYRPSFVSGAVFISPFGFYFGECAPFISRDRCYVLPTVTTYVDIPMYDGDVCRGFGPISGYNYLDRADLVDREPGLANAIEELRECFMGGNIDALVSLTDQNVRIAVFLRGKYSYSLEAGDYVDLTRDALQSTQTISFDITRVHRRAAGVFVVSGAHVYRDRDGRTRKVYVSYVLQEFHDVWTLTEVGTAPDRIEQFR